MKILIVLLTLSLTACSNNISSDTISLLDYTTPSELSELGYTQDKVDLINRDMKTYFGYNRYDGHQRYKINNFDIIVNPNNPDELYIVQDGSYLLAIRSPNTTILYKKGIKFPNLVDTSIFFDREQPFIAVAKDEQMSLDINLDGVDAVFEKIHYEGDERFQHECDQKSIARSCYEYASYQNLTLEDYKQSYDYFEKAFDLGMEKAGTLIGYYQINYPEIFNDESRLDIDQTIHYLQQAFDVGSSGATRLLTVIYREPEFNRIDYDKSEYYNKIAIKQNVKMSRFLLASLYTNEMKDKSKIDESIKLYQDDLMLEKNWESALILMTIYSNPEKYGANIEPDLIKTLAYAYVSSDLRDGRNEDEFNGVDTRFARAMQTELSPETLKQAKAIYFELMAKMNEERINLDNAIPKND